MKVLIAGDYSPRYRVAPKISKGLFSDILGPVKPIISAADYSIVNFESTISGAGTVGIKKAGPCLQCDEKAVEALSWAGFKCATLANNHFRDYDEVGVCNTIKALDNYGIDHVGGGVNKADASRILYVPINEKKLALINACEEEFSIASDTRGGSNLLSPISQYYAIKEAKEKADIVIVIIHGGIEHFQHPTFKMKEIYRFFIEVGADAVVNHHQHCYGGYEIFKGKPIFYGLGNFCFDHIKERHGQWNEGFMVELEFRNNELPAFRLYPYFQCFEEARVVPMTGMQEVAFNRKIEKLNVVINDETQLKEEYENFLTRHSINYDYMFTPWSNRYLVALCNRKLIPQFFSNKKGVVLYNYLVCQSHRDNLINLLKKKLFGS